MITPIELMELLGRGKKTGVLTGKKDNTIRNLYLTEGCIVGVTSTNPKDRLGNVLIREKLITDEKLNELINIQMEDGKLLGELLQEMDEISVDQLMKSLRIRSGTWPLVSNCGSPWEATRKVAVNWRQPRRENGRRCWN